MPAPVGKAPRLDAGRSLTRPQSQPPNFSPNMATEEQVISLHEQVTSIEQQLSDGRYESRLTKLENEVFGAARR